MTTEDLADRIMSRIERDGAIHKSSIVQELEWFQFQQVCAENVSEKVSKGARSVQDEINNLIKNAQERMKIEEAFCGITDLLRGSKRQGDLVSEMVNYVEQLRKARGWGSEKIYERIPSTCDTPYGKLRFKIVNDCVQPCD